MTHMASTNNVINMVPNVDPNDILCRLEGNTRQLRYDLCINSRRALPYLVANQARQRRETNEFPIFHWLEWWIMASRTRATTLDNRWEGLITTLLWNALGKFGNINLCGQKSLGQRYASKIFTCRVVFEPTYYVIRHITINSKSCDHMFLGKSTI